MTTRKNPDSKPLKIVRVGEPAVQQGDIEIGYIEAIKKIMECEARLIQGGKSSGLTHFIACIKELERLYGFRFEELDDEDSSPVLSHPTH